MQDQLEGLQMGDTVTFVATTGAECPAILLTDPFRCMETTQSGWWGARLHVLNGHANSLAVPNYGEIVPFSTMARTGCFYLNEKQRGMLNQWNAWKAMTGNVAAPSEECNQNGMMLLGQSAMASSQGAPAEMQTMGGPIHGGALPDGTSGGTMAPAGIDEQPMALTAGTSPPQPPGESPP